MERKHFIKAIGTGIFGITVLSAFKNLNSMPGQKEQLQLNTQSNKMTQEIATFGAVHLNVTNLQNSISFWTDMIGMKVRYETAEYTELGTGKNTLVVLY